MRVCWNRQTGTCEGRVSMTYEFKSRHSHQSRASTRRCVVEVLLFLHFSLAFKVGYEHSHQKSRSLKVDGIFTFSLFTFNY